MTFDLKTEEGLLAYLTQHLSLDVDLDGLKRLSGGFVNITWRIRLNAPFKGYTNIILKHAQPHLSSDENFKIGVERSAYEYRALKIVSESPILSGDDNLVFVPQSLHYDVVHNALIVQDVGSLKTLMDYVTAKPSLSSEMAQLVGGQIGAFIARLHNIGRENKDHPEFNFFSGNIVGRTTAVQLYETIVPNATKYDIDDPIIPVVVQELIEEVKASDETLIMADLWGGNILLEFGKDSSDLAKIWVVDWELCKYGPPSLDMGYFLGDCFLLAQFQDEQVATAMRRAYLENYAKVAKVPMDYNKSTTGIGAHLVMWTDFMNWGSDEERKTSVEKGVRAFHDAKRDNKEGEIPSILLRESSRT